MKRILAILALFGVVLILPLSATALILPAPNGQPSQPASQGTVVPPAAGNGDEAQGQQDVQGDPDELGGGFRNHGAPPNSTGADPGGVIWIDPLFVLVMQLF